MAAVTEESEEHIEHQQRTMANFLLFSALLMGFRLCNSRANSSTLRSICAKSLARFLDLLGGGWEQRFERTDYFDAG